MLRTFARLAVLLAALLTGLLLFASPASAATPPPAGGASSIATGTSCVPNDTTGCVIGTLRDASQDALKGVTVSLSAKSGGTPVATKTNANGQYYFSVTAAGTYTVTIDPKTLPKGTKTTVTSKDLQVTLSALRAGIFPITGTASGDKVASTTGPNLLQQIWGQTSLGLLLGLLLALASIGLSLVYGTTGLSNFAHAEQVTLGGILTYVLGVQIGLPFVLAAIIAIALCAVSGAVQDRLIWQPLRRRGLGLTQLMVVTIGLQLALEYVYQFFFGADVLTVTSDIQLQTGPLAITPNAYLSMLISIVVLIGVGLALTRTRIGRATRAVADNRALAAASGIDVDRIIRLVWTVSTALAGLAGILYAVVYGGIRWNTGAELLLLVFAAVTLGGLGTAFGALVGSLVIGLVVQLSTLVLSSQLKYASALLILILVLVFRPQGILGRRQRVG